MTIYKKPDLKVFGANAKPTEIAEFEDLLRGWGITIEKTNGIPPMEWFNYLFNRLDGNINYILQNGITEYDTDLEYPQNAVVKSGGKLYLCLRQNTNKPLSNGAYWELLIKNATTSQSGTVQLSNAIDSTDETKASTPKATKTAYNKAVEAYNLADSKLNKVYYLTSENLDDLTESGFYSQARTAQATPELNYPEKNAGVLFLNRYSDGIQTQIYTTYNTYTVYQRYGRKGAWNEWVKVSRRDISSSTNSTNEEVSASSLAVKTVNDKANKLEQNKLDKSALSSSVTSTSESNVATSLAVKKANDNANSRLKTDGSNEMSGTLKTPELYIKQQQNGIRLFRDDFTLAVEGTWGGGGANEMFRAYIPSKNGTLLIDEDIVGSIFAFATNKSKNGFLRCDGGLYSTTTYARLFAEIGYTWGGSGNKFAVPNLTDKARFLRSDGNGLKVGTYQNDAIRNINGYFFLDNVYSSSNYGGAFSLGETVITPAPTGDVGDSAKIKFDASRVVPTSTENRPYSAVVAYWIKY